MLAHASTSSISKRFISVPSNAESPIFVTEFGIVMLASPVQPQNA